VAFHPWQMIVALGFGYLLRRANRTPIQVHEATVRRGMGKDHAAAAPVAGRMRPGARRRIAHAVLLCQCERHAALLQVRLTAAPRQSGLEGGELLGQVGPRWDGRRRCGWIGGARPRGCWWTGKRREQVATVRSALLAGWRLPEGSLALLLLAPLRPRRVYVAPRPTGKAHKTAAVHLHTQAPLAVGAVKPTQSP